MSEESMVEAVQKALTERGDSEQVLAAGQFNPRGHSGALFVGGLGGAGAGGTVSEVVEDVGLAAGSLAGMRALDAASGLPNTMLVGVTPTKVYGFAARSRSKVPDQLAFEVDRAGLDAKVHKRMNVRVLELIHSETNSRIELEGNRLPITHSKDVIDELTS